MGSYGNNLTIDVPRGTTVLGAEPHGRTPVPNGGDRYIIHQGNSVSITINGVLGNPDGSGGSGMSVYGGDPLQPLTY